MDDILVRVGKFASALIIPAFIGGASVILFMNKEYVTKQEFNDHKATLTVSRVEFDKHAIEEEQSENNMNEMKKDIASIRQDLAFMKGYLVKGGKLPDARN